MTTMTTMTESRNTNMNRIYAGLAAAGLVLAAAPIAAQDVRVTISGEVAPGVYGRVDFGNRPPPPVLYPQPVVIVKPARPGPAVTPLYLHVPPGHAKNWSKHCKKYDACGRPVYFVRSAEHEPGYQHPGKGAGKSAGKGKGRD
jgi:hypothetical protein